MTINLQLPQKTTLKPSITVFGVGGAGGNAVNNMIKASLEGINFVVANTDSQALEGSTAENKIQLGETLTQGLGAGSYPEVGKAAAEEAMDSIMDFMQGSNMIFITAGMGGGTGTGAAPVVARLAREQGILTIAVVTKPFHFEGSHRMRVAEQGIQELQKYVDTLIVTPNQNLFRIADKETTFQDAFKLADDVLRSGVQGVTDLMVMPGLINLDFADIRSVMSEMGKAMMGTGEASGEDRAIQAAEAAISNPLLDNVSMKGARGVLINITGGADMTLFEVDEAANRVRDEVDPDANIIFGSTYNESAEGNIRVSVVATGIDVAADGSGRDVNHIFAGASAEEDESEGDLPAFSASGSGSASDEGDDDETFVSPEPVEPPESEVAKSIIESANATKKAAEEIFGGDNTRKKRGLGIFGIGSRKAEENEREEERVEASRKEVAAAQNAAEEEKKLATASVQSKESDDDNLKEDVLDIPAFLRRKNN